MRASEISAVDAAELTSQALDQSGNIIVIASALEPARLGLRIEHVNSAFTVTFGYSAEEALGRPLDLLIAPETSETALAAIRQSINRGRSLQLELLSQHQNGQPRWLGLHFMALSNSEVDHPRYVIQGRDITDKLRERQEQRSAQQLLASVFLFVDSPVAIVNESGAVRMANPPLAELLERPPAAIEGRPWTDLLDARERDKDLEVRKSHAAGQRQTRFPVHLLRPDGAILPATAVSAVVDREGLDRFRVITFHHRPGGIHHGRVPPHPPLENRESRFASKLTLTGLETIRSGLGVRWAEQADQAFLTAEEILRRHLATDESFMRTDDHGFLLTLHDESEGAAAFRAAVIAREIRDALIEAGTDAVGAQVTAISARLETGSESGPDPVLMMDMLNRRLAAQRGRIEHHAEQVLREALEHAASMLEAVTGADPQKPAPLACVTLPEKIERQITAAKAALPPSRLEAFDLDAFMLTLAAERIAEDVLTAAPKVYLVSIAFEALANRRQRRRFIEACQSLDQPVQRRLAFLLAGIPRLTPQARIADTIQTMTPFCRFVGLALERLELPEIDFSHRTIPIVALAASSISAGAAAPGRELSRLAALLRVFNTHLLVRRVAGAEQAAELRQSGVELFSWA
ncbi:MAG: PAS domain-containing protein [Acetobacteraceae bacterium]